MLLHQEAGDGVDVLAVVGQVAGPDARRLVEAVDTALERQPRGVVVDLCQVTDVEPAAAEALRVLAGRGSNWPRASLCLCGAPPSVERALDDLVVHRTREEALAHVEDGGARGHRVVPIDHDVHGPAQARRVVAECAARLGLEPEQGEDLLLVVSEMVTNAVRHGQPPVQLELVAEPDRVTVAVADGSPRPPQPRPADAEAEGGRGMALLEVLANEHGVRPQPPGKAVWAAVRRRPAAAGPEV